jgi:hypothetical protein
MRIIFVSIVVLLFGCSKDENMPLPKKEFTLSIDSVLTQSGMSSLPLDKNGYYHLKLDETKNQTVHRITGRILINGKEPTPAEKIEWESNLYWLLQRNDTITTITKSYINYFTGQYTIVKLPPMIASKDELVPTINANSYSGTKGEFNTMIAPIYKMKGDTMVVKASNYTSNLFAIKKIVLE